MFCGNCGQQMEDNATVCSNCGHQTNNSGATESKVVNHTIVTTDSSSFGWGLLGFCIPIIGLILWIVWHKTTPLKAKSAGMGALISIIIGIVLAIIFFVIMVVFFGILGSASSSAYGGYYYY